MSEGTFGDNREISVKEPWKIIGIKFFFMSGVAEKRQKGIFAYFSIKYLPEINEEGGERQSWAKTVDKFLEPIKCKKTKKKTFLCVLWGFLWIFFRTEEKLCKENWKVLFIFFFNNPCSGHSTIEWIRHDSIALLSNFINWIFSAN